MQTGLLDYIFKSAEIPTLNRQEVLDYLRYLNEIITKDMSTDDQVKFLATKVKLNNRLLELDKEISNL